MIHCWRNTLLAAILAIAPLGLAHAVEPPAAGPAVRDAWARATPPGAQVGAVYLTLVGGKRADRLLAARTDRAAMTEIHSVTVESGVSRMRPLPEGVAVPAGATVTLAPEGIHLMLMMLERPLVAGEKFDVTLTFEGSGERKVPVSVRPAATPPAPH